MKIKEIGDLKQLVGCIITKIILNGSNLTLEIEDKNEQHFLLTLFPQVAPAMVGNLLSMNATLHLKTEEIKQKEAN